MIGNTGATFLNGFLMLYNTLKRARFMRWINGFCFPNTLPSMTMYASVLIMFNASVLIMFSYYCVSRCPFICLDVLVSLILFTVGSILTNPSTQPVSDNGA